MNYLMIYFHRVGQEIRSAVPTPADGDRVEPADGAGPSGRLSTLTRDWATFRTHTLHPAGRP
ncbi:hypothetical protein ACQP1K_29275 (plasmid) [Sphaerimonospora sp. CA-214678]|uniref:hypothetical protein n=1 Tax=Sphaerimonospora sp. CA-214678 TaxID=3240029 RepID=UPI003D8BA025